MGGSDWWVESVFVDDQLSAGLVSRAMEQKCLTELPGVVETLYIVLFATVAIGHISYSEPKM